MEQFLISLVLDCVSESGYERKHWNPANTLIIWIILGKK